jgi:hypothetical protein
VRREETALQVTSHRTKAYLAAATALLCAAPGQLFCAWAPFVFLLLLTLKLDGVKWDAAR